MNNNNNNGDFWAIKINGHVLGVADPANSVFKTFAMNKEQAIQFAEEMEFIMPQASVELVRINVDMRNTANEFHLPSEGKTLENAKGYFKEF